MAHLFSPWQLRQLTLANRIWMSPMCQYSAVDGQANDWHLVHLGSRAVGGASLVMMEATAVTPEGRISPADTGLWSDSQIVPLQRITRFLKQQGSVPAIQLAHAGRKASTQVPWKGGHPLAPAQGGWQPVAPSAEPFSPDHTRPRALDHDDLHEVAGAFERAALRSLEAGFEVVEIHMAHGYLLHEFLSPLSNGRQDDFGGHFDNRVRLPLLVAEAVRRVWPDQWPVLVRISASDWVEGGWDLAQSIELAKRLKAVGIDLIDCSSGGVVPSASIPVAPHYQVPFAEAIRREAGMATGAVGLISEPAAAERIIADGQADVILLGRALLRDPYWPLHAAGSLGVQVSWPNPYLRAT